MPPVQFELADTKAFARDIDQLRAEIDESLGEKDWKHLRRFEWAARLCLVAGYATAWMAFNPVSALLMSTGTFVLWAVVMHHVGHRGYDKVPGAPRRYSSRVYAQGWRRWFDWPDWMPAEAWLHEHNALHHSRTNEAADPDLVFQNTSGLRDPGFELLRYPAVLFFGLTWKWSYYAPGTFRALHLARARRRREPRPEDSPEGLRKFFNVFGAGRPQWARLLNPATKEGREIWLRSYVPYVGLRFVLIPLAFLPLGWSACVNVLLNSVLAEALTNLHGFVTIVPNHAGGDVPVFDTQARDRAEFYLHQIVGSVNYTSPGTWSDFLQGGLNFQIEHHVWPDLPLSKYREFAPRLRAVCERHGVPYKEEPLPWRLQKLWKMVLGDDAPPVALTGKREGSNEPLVGVMLVPEVE